MLFYSGGVVNAYTTRDDDELFYIDGSKLSGKKPAPALKDRSFEDAMFEHVLRLTLSVGSSTWPKAWGLQNANDVPYGVTRPVNQHHSLINQCVISEHLYGTLFPIMGFLRPGSHSLYDYILGPFSLDSAVYSQELNENSIFLSSFGCEPVSYYVKREGGWMLPWKSRRILDISLDPSYVQKDSSYVHQECNDIQLGRFEEDSQEDECGRDFFLGMKFPDGVPTAQELLLSQLQNQVTETDPHRLFKYAVLSGHALPASISYVGEDHRMFSLYDSANFLVSYLSGRHQRDRDSDLVQLKRSPRFKSWICHNKGLTAVFKKLGRHTIPGKRSEFEQEGLFKRVETVTSQLDANPECTTVILPDVAADMFAQTQQTTGNCGVEGHYAFLQRWVHPVTYRLTRLAIWSRAEAYASALPGVDCDTSCSARELLCTSAPQTDEEAQQELQAFYRERAFCQQWWTGNQAYVDGYSDTYGNTIVRDLEISEIPEKPLQVGCKVVNGELGEHSQAVRINGRVPSGEQGRYVQRSDVHEVSVPEYAKTAVSDLWDPIQRKDPPTLQGFYVKRKTGKMSEDFLEERLVRATEIGNQCLAATTLRGLAFTRLRRHAQKLRWEWCASAPDFTPQHWSDKFAKYGSVQRPSTRVNRSLSTIESKWAWISAQGPERVPLYVWTKKGAWAAASSSSKYQKYSHSAREGQPYEVKTEELRDLLKMGWVVRRNSVALTTFARSFPNPERAAELLATLAVDVKLNAHADLPGLARELQEEFAGLFGKSPTEFAQGTLGESLAADAPTTSASDGALPAGPLDEFAFMNRLCYHALSFEAAVVVKDEETAAKDNHNALPAGHEAALQHYRDAYRRLKDAEHRDQE